MDMEEHIKSGHNKNLNQELNIYVGHSQERFDELMQYVLHDEYRLCQRASWTLGKVCETRPWLMEKWLPEILKALEKPKHDALIRNVVRAFQGMDELPEEYEGEIFEKCFNYLLDPSYAVAIKAFSMTVCRKVAMKYPDLKPELIEVINDVLVNGSSGILSRGRKEIYLLSK